MVKVIICKATIGSNVDHHEYSTAEGLFSIKMGGEKATQINGGFSEPVKLSVEVVSDDFLDNLMETQLVDLGDITYYDVLVQRDDAYIYRGVLSTEGMERDYGSGIMTLNAYGYEYIFTRMSSIVSVTPKFSFDAYLSEFNQYLSGNVHRGGFINFPLPISANNGYLGSVRIVRSLDPGADVIDAGMVFKPRNVYVGTNLVDSWHYYEYRYVAYRVVNDWDGDSLKWRIRRTIGIYGVYNNNCIEEELTSSELLSATYSSEVNAINDIPNQRVGEYYPDTDWINSTFSNYSILDNELYVSTNVLPVEPVFKDGTSYEKMLKAYFLMHKLTFVFSGYGFLPNGKPSTPQMTVITQDTTGNTGNDVTSRITSMKDSRMDSPSIDLSPIDELRGDCSIIKSYLTGRYSQIFASVKQFKIVVDDLSLDDLHIYDVIVAYGINVKIMELRKDIVNDEYVIKAWRVDD